MFAFVDLIFIIIKIATLSVVYASCTLAIFVILSKTSKSAWLKKITQTKFTFWLSSGFIYSALMYFYVFSSWGDRGLGDSWKLPIGNGYHIGNIDGCSTYFEDQKTKYSRQAFLGHFALKNNKLCSEFFGFNSTDCNDCFIVFDIKEAKMIELHSGKEYSDYAIKNNLPKHEEFKDFFELYKEYWGGWRTWLLP